MKDFFLDFEKPIAELANQIEQLRIAPDDTAPDRFKQMDRLQKKSDTLVKDIYAKLTPWQISQVSRHPQRPYTDRKSVV